MRQKEDLRFGGALLEAALANLRADLWAAVLPAGSGTPIRWSGAPPTTAGHASDPRSPVARPPWRVADSRERMMVPEDLA
jgi:hypothetical protein